ncbi:MAG TPA: biotin/lipoyl-binding protein, partial [Tichowtungia sp.]|nr:biotin/lipoyl-binding protein [Tichowtungia sp.]
MKKKERSSKQNKRSFPKNGLRIILAVIVVLAVIAWQADLFTPKLEAGEEADTRPVANEKSLVDVREAQVPVQRTFTGSVVSRIRVERTPQIGGTVEQVLVEAGDEVQEDELLMRLNPDLPAARRDEARAALQQAESALTGAERLLDRITRAVEADTLPETRRIEAEQAKDSAAAAVQQAEAALQAAETQLGYTEIRS